MLNYRVQDGCHNCAHVFVHYDYGEEDTYFCALNAPERPLCGSLKMREGPGSTLAVTRVRFDVEAWRKWAFPRCVEHGGICDAWEKDPLDGIENDDQPQYILADQGKREGAT